MLRAIAVAPEVTIPAALTRLVTVLLLLAFPARAHGFPEDAPLASRESSCEATGKTQAEACEEFEDASRERERSGRHFWLALGEVTAVNAAVWSVDWFIRGRPWAKVSPEVWKHNLTGGFEWDSDKFTANQFDHPLHGAAYYNVARDNGFSYWESSLFTLFGSLQWELFAENNPPSINDVINTSIGGLALGEAEYRLTSMILDNRATGRERVGRELASAVLNPGRAVNRLYWGDLWRQGPNPRDRTPPLFDTFGQTGFLKEGDDSKGVYGEGQLYVQLSLRYGDPFLNDIHKPFDSFTLEGQFITRQGHLVSHAEVEGVLAATALVREPRQQLLLSAHQAYEYTDIGAYDVGSQSFSAGLLYRHALWGQTDVRASMQLRGLVLAAISSAPSERQGRGYDYGPGLGLRLRAVLGPWPWEYASLEVASSWVHTLNGTEYDHLINEGRLQVDIPVYRRLGMGGSFQLFRRDILLGSQNADTVRTPQFQVFLSLH